MISWWLSICSMSLEVTHHYSGKVQESPPFTTHLLSLFAVYLSLLFGNGNCWTLKQCLKLSGSSLQFQTSPVIWPRFWYFFFLPKCPKISFVCKIPHIYVIVVLLLLIMQVHVPELSRSSTEALRFRAPELSSHDNGLMEIEAQYFGKAETGILRAYVLGKQKCLRFWLKGIENKAFYISPN